MYTLIHTHTRSLSLSLSHTHTYTLFVSFSRIPPKCSSALHCVYVRAFTSHQTTYWELGRYSPPTRVPWLIHTQVAHTSGTHKWHTQMASDGEASAHLNDHICLPWHTTHMIAMTQSRHVWMSHDPNVFAMTQSDLCPDSFIRVVTPSLVRAFTPHQTTFWKPKWLGSVECLQYSFECMQGSFVRMQGSFECIQDSLECIHASTNQTTLWELGSFFFVLLFFFLRLFFLFSIPSGSLGCLHASPNHILGARMVFLILNITKHNSTVHWCKYDMRWLRLVGSLKSQVSFAKEPYKRDYILQKRPIILRNLLNVATP